MTHQVKLPQDRPAVTHRFRVGEQTGYIRVGLYDDGRPGEIFLNVNKAGSTVRCLFDAWATAVSYALQYGVPLDELTRKFANTRFEPCGPTDNPDIPEAHSVLDYACRWLAVRYG